MNQTVLNNEVLKSLNEFDTLGTIQPSAQWNESLMEKLATSKPSSSVLPKTKFTVIVLLIVLFNIGFILKVMINNSGKTQNRNSELSVISKELLINPITINN